MSCVSIILDRVKLTKYSVIEVFNINFLLASIGNSKALECLALKQIKQYEKGLIVKKQPCLKFSYNTGF